MNDCARGSRGVVAFAAWAAMTVGGAAGQGAPEPPVGIVWSASFGGSVEEGARALARDEVTGDLIVAGYTDSPDLPTTRGAFDTSHGGGRDAFVARLSSDGATLHWLTYLGGGGHDEAHGVALRATGEIVVGGLTGSADFPTTPGALSTTPSIGFVATLTSDGADLVWSTFVPGARVRALALDAQERIAIGGTASGAFASLATPGAFDTTYNGGLNDGFAALLHADGHGAVFATYIGGSCAAPYEGSYALSVTPSGLVTVAGLTCSTDFPTTAGAPQSIYGGGTSDAFVARFDTNGALLFATYLGGDEFDMAWALDESPPGSVIVAGQADSIDFPVTQGAYDTTQNDEHSPDPDSDTGVGDAFVTWLDVNAGALVASTFLGGSQNDHVHAVRRANSGAIVAVGSLSSPDFPTTPGAHDETRNGGQDAFVARISVDLANLEYSSYLGGLDRSVSHALLVDDSAGTSIVTCGPSRATDFPLTPSTAPVVTGGDWDGFVTRIELLACDGTTSEYASGCAGASDFAPALEVTGCPASGSFIFLPLRYLSTAGETAFFFVGLGDTSLALPGGCTLDVAPLALAAPVMVFLPATSPFGGAVSLPAELPPGLVPVAIHVQAVLVAADGAATLSVTNAVTFTPGP